MKLGSMPRLETLIGGISRRRFLGTTAAVSAGLMMGGRRASAQGTSALRARSNSDIQNIDPINPAATADQNVMQAVFNRLVNFKPGTEWEWELDAADSIEVLDDAVERKTCMDSDSSATLAYWAHNLVQLFRGEAESWRITFTGDNMALGKDIAENTAPGLWASVIKAGLPLVREFLICEQP